MGAYGACNNGYYLKDGECTTCIKGYYCTNDTLYLCPENNTNFIEVYGGTVIDISPAYSITNASTPEHCVGQIKATNYRGKYKAECRWNGVNYYDSCNGNFGLWYEAAPGYYLSQYNFSSSYKWYRAIKACTNAPEFAHYTGAGTPDEPVKTGGATDYNDCPWECDDGYGKYGNACVPLCTAGIQYIKTGSGLIFNLYPVAYSTPALHIKYNGNTCYGALATGAATGAINIKYGDTVYHTVN